RTAGVVERRREDHSEAGADRLAAAVSDLGLEGLAKGCVDGGGLRASRLYQDDDRLVIRVELGCACGPAQVVVDQDGPSLGASRHRGDDRGVVPYVEAGSNAYRAGPELHVVYLREIAPRDGDLRVHRTARWREAGDGGRAGNAHREGQAVARTARVGNNDIPRRGAVRDEDGDGR